MDIFLKVTAVILVTTVATMTISKQGVKQCIDRGITPPVWSSANTPGGDEKNAKYLEKYKPRIKML